MLERGRRSPHRPRASLALLVTLLSALAGCNRNADPPAPAAAPATAPSPASTRATEAPVHAPDPVPATAPSTAPAQPAAAPLPEFYGTYAVDGPALIDFTKPPPGVDLTPAARFILFEREVTFGRKPTLYRVNVQADPESHPAPEVVAARFKPVPDQPDMVWAVPEAPLRPGVYRVDAGAPFHVDRTAFVATLAGSATAAITAGRLDDALESARVLARADPAAATKSADLIATVATASEAAAKKSLAEARWDDAATHAARLARLAPNNPAARDLAARIPIERAAATKRDEDRAAAEKKLAAEREQAVGAKRRTDAFLAQSEMIRKTIPAAQVVFVCDASGRMMVEFPQARQDIGTLIDQLNDPQAFNVIFASEGGKYSAFPAPMSAGPVNKRRAVEFCDKAGPHGINDVTPALDMALRGGPDVIWFIAGGEFNDTAAVLQAFEQGNPKKRTRVNTVVLFDDPESHNLMRRIAETYGGACITNAGRNIAGAPEAAKPTSRPATTAPAPPATPASPAVVNVANLTVRSGTTTLTFDNITIDAVADGNLLYRMNGRLSRRPLAAIIRLDAPGVLHLAEAEDAMASGDVEQATAAYKELAASAGSGSWAINWAIERLRQLGKFE